MPEIPGSTINAHCRNCDADTPHTVLEVLDEGKRIVRVRCNNCREEHPFRRPKTAAASAKSKVAQPTPPRPRSKLRAPAESPPDDAWCQVEAMIQAATKLPYDMQRSYEKGDVIDHPHFGMGVVTAVLSPTKVEVLFRSGHRKLVCGLQPAR